MQMQKGICLELNNDRSVFILKDGRFVEGRPADGAAVGEEVYFFPKVKRTKSRLKSIAAPVVLAAAILMLVLSALLPSQEAYAYVQIEVNPSIEIGTDENLRVVSLRELNKDGMEVVSKIKDWENLSLDEVLEKAIRLSLRESTEEVTITTVVTSDEKEHSEGLEAAVMAVSAKVAKEKLEVHLKEASPAQWRKAVKDNVPVGQKVEDFKVFKESSKAKEIPADKKPAVKEKSEQKDSRKDPVKAAPQSPVQPKESPAPEQEKKQAPPGQ
ncbi:anti-sigma factor domain-containing protein, partial [Planococcus ruber]|uniref:anti-sigma factor domain-containing protein n=1 Tax=Planococcus ruber TaxID=2027871 RepID=UPI001FEF579F